MTTVLNIGGTNSGPNSSLQPAPITALLQQTLTSVAAVYVSTSGSDTNSGLDWNNAFATLQAAINALPSTGGLIEVGAGTFTDPRGYTSIDSTINPSAIHIRGRGIGRAIEEGQTTEVHPTVIASTLIVRAAVTTGTPNTPENLWAGATLVEDCAFVVPANSGWSNNGVGGLHNSPWLHFRRCAFDSCGSHGVMAINIVKFASAPVAGATSATLDYPFYTATFSGSAVWFVVTSTGQVISGSTLTSASSTVTFGSAITGTPNQYAIVYTGASNVGYQTEQWFSTYEKCLFINNGGAAFIGGAQVTGFFSCHFENNKGLGSGSPSSPFTGTAGNFTAAVDLYTLSASQDVSFYNCIIQRQVSGCGAISFNGITLNATGCHFENNPNTSKGAINIVGGVATFTSCYLIPSASQFWLIYINASNCKLRVVGCYTQSLGNLTNGFTNATAAGYVFSGATYGNRFSSAIQGAIDGLLTDGSSSILGANPIGGINTSLVGNGMWTSGLVLGAFQQALGANGAVTFDASTSSNQIIVLAANATSSTISNPSHGQILSLSWEQDNTGSRTYVWPTNCKFAGNSAPVASTAANTVDTVTFQGFYTGTNYYWREIARSIGVPAPAT